MMNPNSPDIKIVCNADATDKATFIITGEDHTLGNALRYMLIRNPNVSFCGYSIPHPSEPKMNMRLQSTGEEVNAVMKTGLSDLTKLTAHIKDTFTAAVDEFDAGGVAMEEEEL